MKLLIQGCGYIGQVHLKTIRNNGLCDVAICDTNPARLEEVAKKFNVSETYTSLDEALKHPFDGAVICTPNFAHRGDLEKCVNAGLNVMMEKPVAESVEAAKAIVEACERTGKFAFVAYCLRFAKPYQTIKGIIQSGKLGKVFSIRASVAGKKAITDAFTDYRTKRALGGGVISDFSHEIDYSLWFADSPVVNAIGAGSRAVHKDWDVLDTAELIIMCENNISLSIHMDFLQPYFGRTIEIYGTEGAIRFRDNEPIKLYTAATDTWENLDSEVNFDDVYRDEMVHYLDCLRGVEKPCVDAEAGYELMRVIEACTRSAEVNEH